MMESIYNQLTVVSILTLFSQFFNKHILNARDLKGVQLRTAEDFNQRKEVERKWGEGVRILCLLRPFSLQLQEQASNQIFIKHSTQTKLSRVLN